MKGQWIIKEVYFEEGFPKIIRDLKPETPYTTLTEREELAENPTSSAEPLPNGKTMTDRDLFQQALESLQYASDETKPEGLHGCECLICKTIADLKDRLKEKNHD